MGLLFRIAGFTPFVGLLFLNAFVDLGHKIIVQNTVFKVFDGQVQIILTAIVNGLILLPFVLLFTPAGFISDRFQKPRVMRISAMFVVGLTLLITLCYYNGWFDVAFVITFLLAIQSAFFSPAKYGYIKEVAGNELLASANAVVQAVTIVAILAGTFFYSVLFEAQLDGLSWENESELLTLIAPIGWVLVACASVELLLAFRLTTPRTQTAPIRFDWQRYVKGSYLKSNLQSIHENRTIWLSIIGLAVFWAISQVLLASFPSHAKDHLGETSTVIVQGIMACAGLGIILGSLIAGRASRHYIETGLIPLGSLGIVIALLFIPFLESTWLLAGLFFMLGMFGGMLIVPLNALIQFNASDDRLGTVLAGSNWVQNVVMLAFLLLTVVFAATGTDSYGLFAILAVVALVGTVYTIMRLPYSLVRYTIAFLFAGWYRIDVQGFRNIPAQGSVLMLGNHISWLDWAFAAIASPRPIHFVMFRDFYQRWYIKWFLDIFGVIPISMRESRAALKQINELLKAGEMVCLFPEGSMSRNGQLGEFKRGYEQVTVGVEGVILPFYLRGLWGSRFSRSSSKLRMMRKGGLRRDIIVSFGETIPISSHADEVKRRVFNLSIDAWEQHSQSLDPLPLAWMRAVKKTGSNLCLADYRNRESFTGRQALARAIRLSRFIGSHSSEQNIAILLPTGSLGIMTNMAAMLLGRTVVNLDINDTAERLSAQLSRAQIKTVYTSQTFLDRLEGRGIDLAPLRNQSTVLDLDAAQAGKAMRAGLALRIAVRLLPARWLYLLSGQSVSINDPAAILFPADHKPAARGVVLTHRNIMANIRQVSNVLNMQEDDVFISSMPLHEAYGLTATSLLPLVEGMPLVCHPDPNDALNIARAIARYKVTVYCGRSSYLSRLVDNRKVRPMLLDSLRLVIAGSEKLGEDVRDSFKLKFNKDIYEGYGTTETTPVASVNLPDRIDTNTWHFQLGNKPGTVGMPLPGSNFRIVDPDTLRDLPTGETGLILIGGTQVMQGYLDEPDLTADAIVHSDNRRWYKSRDYGSLDEDGFLTIADHNSGSL